MSNFTSLSKLDAEAFKAGFKSGLNKEAGFGQSLYNFADHYIKPIAKPFFRGQTWDNLRTGWQGMRKEFNTNPNATFDTAASHGLGAMEGQRLDAVSNQTGVQFNHNANGGLDQANPVNFGGTANKLWDNFKGWAGNQWNQATSNPMEWAKNNPWTATGTTLLGGLGVYGASKMLGGLFGGNSSGGNNQPQQNNGMGQPYASPAPSTGPTVQAMPKMGEFSPLGVSPLALPRTFAMAMVGHHQPQMMQQEEPEAYEPQFSSDDVKLRRALQNPKMKEYLINLLQTHG